MYAQYFQRLSQLVPNAAITDTTPPTFAGISGLVANANGSLTATWSAATDATSPISYPVYIQAGTATGLFNALNLAGVRKSGTSITLFTDATGAPLVNGTTYFVGVRATDAVGNENTNTASLSAISLGVPDNSVINLLNTINGKIGTPVGTVSSDIANLDSDVAAVQSSVNNIQNNTMFSGTVQSPLILPESGSKDYIFYARVFNESGSPADPDSNTITITVKTSAGATVAGPTSMIRSAVGQYRYTYTVLSNDPERALFVFFDYDRLGVPYSQVRSTEVQEFESKLDILLNRLTQQRADNLDYLDVAITSRATPAQAAASVWNSLLASYLTPGTTGRGVYDAAYAGSTLTPVDYVNIAFAVWDEAISAHTNPNTFGERNQVLISQVQANNLDNLDAQVSTRAPSATAVDKNDLTTVRIAKLDYLDAPITSRTAAGDLAAIQAKTDLIPAVPAQEGTVLAIPTNTLLTNDPRLANLDAPVSSRAQPSDLAPLATQATLLNVQTTLAADIAAVQVALGPKATTVDVNSAVSGLATAAALASVQTSVNTIQTGLITASDVWTYAPRGLTEAVDTTVDLSGLATTAQLDQAEADIIAANDYWHPRASVSIEPTSDVLTLVAWLELNGQGLSDASSCTVNVYAPDNTLVFTVGPDLMTDSQGVFSFTRANASLVLTANNTYTFEVLIVRNSITYRGVTPVTVF